MSLSIQYLFNIMSRWFQESSDGSIQVPRWEAADKLQRRLCMRLLGI